MGLGVMQRSKKLVCRINLLRFKLRKYFLGFENANVFVSKLDKNSLLLVLRKHGATIGKNCDIESGQTFHNCKDYSNLIVGDNCHIGKNCFFDLLEKVQIKENVTISMECQFITHIDVGHSRLIKQYPKTSNSIIINNDVYIGVDVTILSGVEIGDASLIAAKSLVSKNVLPNYIYGGIPAKKIKPILSS